VRQEYALAVSGVFVEHLTANREEVLARETGNKELVEGLSGFRLALKACLGELYGQPSSVVPAL
jgi:hypothetical protein